MAEDVLDIGRGEIEGFREVLAELAGEPNLQRVIVGRISSGFKSDHHLMAHYGPKGERLTHTKTVIIARESGERLASYERRG